MRRRTAVTISIVVLGLIIVGGYETKRRYDNFCLTVCINDQFRTLSHYVGGKVDVDNGTFPITLDPEEMTEDEGRREIAVRDLLVDPATGKSLIYRAVTPKGERLKLSTQQEADGLTRWADRFILWTPEPNREGKRLVLMNNLCVLWIENDRLDFSNQRVISINK